MKKLQGSSTEKNLLKSFAGESQTRTRYAFFASVARIEGYMQIANIFQETAAQEKAHAKRFYQFLEGGEVEITASFPAGVIGTTEENLLSAANGEKEEHSKLYPSFADVADQEGFNEIATLWRLVAVAEVQHEKRYRALLENIQLNQIFEREEEQTWQCSNCGFIHKGEVALQLCPACIHPRAYFEILAENW